MSRRGQIFFQDNMVPVSDKLALLFEIDLVYTNSRGMATISSLFYFPLLGYAATWGDFSSIVLLFMASIPYGYVIGVLWKYIKVNRMCSVF